MQHIRAQITSRSGPAGTKDAPSVGHGDFLVDPGTRSREFSAQLQDVLEAAAHVATDGMVTEVSILVYHQAFQHSVN